MIKIKASYSSQEEREKLLKDLERLDYLKVIEWPKKAHTGKGKGAYENIYIKLAQK